MPIDQPTVRRRYGSILRGRTILWRYHEYSLVRKLRQPVTAASETTTGEKDENGEKVSADGTGRGSGSRASASINEELYEEDRRVVIFHVMPKRTAKGRPSKEEDEAPAALWHAHMRAASQRGVAMPPNIDSQKAASAASAAGPCTGAGGAIGGKASLAAIALSPTKGAEAAAAAAAAAIAAARAPTDGLGSGGVELPLTAAGNVTSMVDGWLLLV